jgi:hypothetical protein
VDPQRLPVELLYDQSKIPENSNISLEVVVPLGKISARSDCSHTVGRRLFEAIRAKNPHDPRLGILAGEDPRLASPGLNHCDRFFLNTLRLSRGVQAMGSNQAVGALAARPLASGIPGEGTVPSLTGTTPQPPPPNQTQVIVMAGKELAGQAKSPMRKWVGLDQK